MGFWGCGLGGMEEKKKSASPKKKPLRGKKVGFAEEKLRLWGLAWAAGWVDIEGRAQNIAPLHLMCCLIAGYNLAGALEGRAQNIAPLHLMRCLIEGYNLEGALEGRAQNIAPPQNYKTILPIRP